MKRMIMILMLVLLAGTTYGASIELDSINFDPAIIAAGDEVDIVVQFHAEVNSQHEDRINNPEYEFKVTLEPDDKLSREHVIILDEEGDDNKGSLFLDEFYNKKFRIKMMNDAPAAKYQFKLVGQWYTDGEPQEGEQSLKFFMDVKKEGIVLDVATIETTPSEVRPGADYVKIRTFIENVGFKDAKSVETRLRLPDDFESSYTNNNRLWIGRVNKGESKEAIFYVDVKEDAEDKVYELTYDLEYMDLDNNRYNKTLTVPFLVKPRPYIEVVDYNGTGLTGDVTKLYVTVKNTGKESAEAVDVRILKGSAQPFTIDVRSDYIGELKPGEEGLAVFDIGVNNDAEIKEHSFKLLIRSKGDSDEGDGNIYTYNRRAKLDVTGKSENKTLQLGIGGAALLFAGLSVYRFARRKQARRRR